MAKTEVCTSWGAWTLGEGTDTEKGLEVSKKLVYRSGQLGPKKQERLA